VLVPEVVGEVVEEVVEVVEVALGRVGIRTCLRTIHAGI